MGRAEAGASPGFTQMLRGWHKARAGGGNLGKKLWISCPLSWEFSIPVLAGLIPRERFHRRKKGRCFQQKHCQEISSLSPKFTGKLAHQDTCVIFARILFGFTRYRWFARQM